MTNLIFFPLAIEVLIILVASIIVTLVLFYYVRKKFSHEKISENHTIASYIFNAFSISYGVLLAFVVYANWYDNNRAQQNVSHEASYISNFYRDTRTLPDSVKSIITFQTSEYVKSIINEEWIFLSEGKSSPITDSALDRLWSTFMSIPVENFRNPYLYQISLERLNFLSEYRRLRILDMQQTMPHAMWIVLIICFLVTITYTYFFMTKQRRAHLFLILTLITVNVLIFYLIYVLDHPYKGSSGISSEPFHTILMKISSGS